MSEIYKKAPVAEFGICSWLKPKVIIPGSIPGWGTKKEIMRLEKFLNEKSEYKIYLDMDGVLTDFDSAFKKIDGRSTTEVEKEGDPAFWEHVKKGGLKFWSMMPWMKDGRKLWNYVKNMDVNILSSPSRSLPDSSKGKKIWVYQALNPTPKLILKRAREKQEYAKPNTILIDDRKKNIDRWNAAGGIGIWHKSANKTIKKLESILGE